MARDGFYAAQCQTLRHCISSLVDARAHIDACLEREENEGVCPDTKVYRLIRQRLQGLLLVTEGQLDAVDTLQG